MTKAAYKRMCDEADERIARRHEEGGDMEQMRKKAETDPLAAAMLAIWDEPQEVR